MIVANWKMHTRASDAYVLATTIRNQVSDVEGIEVVICPPIVWLSEISEILKRDGKVNVGAQNMFYEMEGAFTGETSPLMIRDMAKYVIVGHSERREHFGETDFDVNEKVLAALKCGLSPIICVGEKTKSAPISDAVKQLKEALEHVPKNQYKDIVVAYEPVWAVGTENPASIEHITRAFTEIREIVLRDSPILYGGSVDEKEAEKYAKAPQIDGLLVGSVSLKVNAFISICKTWSRAKSFKADLILDKEEK